MEGLKSCIHYWLSHQDLQGVTIIITNLVEALHLNGFRIILPKSTVLQKMTIERKEQVVAAEKLGTVDQSVVQAHVIIIGQWD